MTVKARKRTREDMRWWLEVRRSNAASPHKNLKTYSRKVKHKGKDSE